MSFVSATEDRNARKSRRTDKGFTHVRMFKVEFDDRNDSPFKAIDRTPVTIGDAHPEDGLARCVDIDPQMPRDDSLQYNVFCRYERDETSGPLSTQSGRNETNVPVFETSSVIRMKAVDKDVANLPITNSAGQLFNPPAQIERSLLAITIKAVVPFENYNLEMPTTWTNTVNIRPFFGLPRDTVMCRGFTANTEQIKGITKWRIAVHFLYDPENWKLKLLDRGTVTADIEENRPESHRISYSTSSFKVTNIEPLRDRSGLDLREPRLLNGKGKVLGEGKPPEIRNFIVYQGGDLNVILNSAVKVRGLTTLGLPTTLDGYKVVTQGR